MEQQRPRFWWLPVYATRSVLSNLATLLGRMWAAITRRHDAR